MICKNRRNRKSGQTIIEVVVTAVTLLVAASFLHSMYRQKVFTYSNRLYYEFQKPHYR